MEQREPEQDELLAVGIRVSQGEGSLEKCGGRGDIPLAAASLPFAVSRSNSLGSSTSATAASGPGPAGSGGGCTSGPVFTVGGSVGRNS